KISLLSAEKEIAMRRRLPAGVKMYTGDDFNYADLIAGDAAGRQAAIDDNRRAVDEAAALAADCLVLVVGGLPLGSKDIAGARRMVADGMA
ncbi:DUF993 family protein, partial [Mycobacterium tuberculosis]|nr:DUF993 family protein [Mycobacterium tuberculosis]